MPALSFMSEVKSRTAHSAPAQSDAVSVQGANLSSRAAALCLAAADALHASGGGAAPPHDALPWPTQRSPAASHQQLCLHCQANSPTPLSWLPQCLRDAMQCHAWHELTLSLEPAPVPKHCVHVGGRATRQCIDVMPHVHGLRSAWNRRMCRNLLRLAVHAGLAAGTPALRTRPARHPERAASRRRAKTGHRARLLPRAYAQIGCLPPIMAQASGLLLCMLTMSEACVACCSMGAQELAYIVQHDRTTFPRILGGASSIFVRGLEKATQTESLTFRGISEAGVQLPHRRSSRVAPAPEASALRSMQDASADSASPAEQGMMQPEIVKWILSSMLLLLPTFYPWHLVPCTFTPYLPKHDGRIAE